jgi:hypothetical protein
MIRVIGDDSGWEKPKLEFKEVTDPIEIQKMRELHEAFKRNSDWIQAHWGDLLPGAFGKHLVVAGQEAFLADTMEEALERAKAAHPDDKGIYVQYVLPHTGPRIYAIRG